MKDLISRQAAIDALKQQAETMSEWSNRYVEQRKGILTAVNIVEDLPPAQPERKTGKWIHNRDEDGWHIWLGCSECGAIEDNTNAKFCPICGSYNGG